jgi:hypothetical protein
MTTKEETFVYSTHKVMVDDLSIAGRKLSEVTRAFIILCQVDLNIQHAI